MRFSTTITSKGTITIAAPIRKAFGFKTGQQLHLVVDKNRQIIIDGGTSIAEFEKLRERVTKEIPNHKKGLTGQVLKDAAAKAWVADYSE